MFEIFGINENQEQKENWKNRKRKLLQKIYEGGPSPYRQSTIVLLAIDAIAAEELERAEELMQELPEHMADTTVLKVQLCRKIRMVSQGKSLYMIQTGCPVSVRSRGYSNPPVCEHQASGTVAIY